MPTHTDSLNDRTAQTCALLMALLGILHVLVGPVGMAVSGAPAILGTMAAIGGGLAAAGIGGKMLSAPDKRSPGSFVPEQNEELFEQADRMRDPSYGFGQFRRLARDSAGTMDQTLQATAATGGSERLAQTRQQQQVQESANNIMEQFGQFRLNTNQQANQLLQQGISNQLQGQQMAQRQNLQRSKTFQDAFGQVASVGGSLLGQGVGGMMGQSMGGGQRISQQIMSNQNALGALRAGRNAGFFPQQQSFSDVFGN
jgi:hypothetical protein